MVGQVEMSDDLMTSSTLSVMSEESDMDLLSGSGSWYKHMLSPEDLMDIDPARGEFVAALMDLIAQKQQLLSTMENESEEAKAKAVSELKLNLKVRISHIFTNIQGTPLFNLLSFSVSGGTLFSIL